MLLGSSEEYHITAGLQRPVTQLHLLLTFKSKDATKQTKQRSVGRPCKANGDGIECPHSTTSASITSVFIYAGSGKQNQGYQMEVDNVWFCWYPWNCKSQSLLNTLFLGWVSNLPSHLCNNLCREYNAHDFGPLKWAKSYLPRGLDNITMQWFKCLFFTQKTQVGIKTQNQLAKERTLKGLHWPGDQALNESWVMSSLRS